MKEKYALLIYNALKNLKSRLLENMMNYTFTVFTPTFNRAASIHRVYESLKSQTFRDFEWLIVDDGSEDDTAILVGNWIKETDFPITYMKQNHAGKHVACKRRRGGVVRYCR